MVAAFALFLFSCVDSDSDSMVKPQPDRVCFSDMNAFEAYLSSYSSSICSTNFSEELSPTSIIGKFKAYTAEGKLLNKDLEFQIGDTIYKYCESGMGMFEISSSKYYDLDFYYGKEKYIVANLENYPEISSFRYRITNGLIFVYTGEPIFDIQKIVTPLPSRTSQDQLAQVQTSFWRKTGATKSSCGVKVEAWSRENTMQKFHAANTDLLLEWNIQVRADGDNVPFRSSRGGLAGKGNIIQQEVFYAYGPVKYTLWENSIITGCAKYQNSWLKAEVTK